MAASILISIDTRGNNTSGINCPLLKVRTRAVPGEDFMDFGPSDLYDALLKLVVSNNLEDRVTVKETVCLWGCTYGPRIDVTVKSPDKNYTILYGRKGYNGPISIRGLVSIQDISQLDSLQNIIYDNLTK